MPIIICQDCGEERKHQARGLCNRCWMRLFRVKNPDSNRAYLKKWYEKNRTTLQADARNRYWSGGVNRLTISSNKNAADRGRIGKLTREQVRTLFPNHFAEIAAAHCIYCESVVVPGTNASLDHVDPDGPHTLDNIVVSCASCNSSRQRATPGEYRARLDQDSVLREHIATRNRQRLTALLVHKYNLTIESILTLITPEPES